MNRDDVSWGCEIGEGLAIYRWYLGYGAIGILWRGLWTIGRNENSLIL